jgi:hypothetical protein
MLNEERRVPLRFFIGTHHSSLPQPSPILPDASSGSAEQIGLHRRIRKVIIHDTRPAHIRTRRVEENTRRRHEVRVPGHIGLLVHPRHDLLQKALQLRLGVGVLIVETKLGDPDGTASGDGTGLVDKVLKVGGAGEFVGVPVDVDKVDGAARAVAHEVLEVGEAGGRAGVGDGGGAEECLAGEWLHVLLVGPHRGVDAHAG